MNISFETSQVPTDLKRDCIRPRLKKPSVYPDILY